MTVHNCKSVMEELKGGRKMGEETLDDLKDGENRKGMASYNNITERH